MIRICPSILNADRSNIGSEVDRIAKESDLLHLDIMDGVFVPNTTFSLEESEKIVSESPIPVDAHLMIRNPENEIQKFMDFGCSSITFHLEATDMAEKCVDLIKSQDVRAGIALKPQTGFSSILDLIEKIDMLLIMTVEPGFGGQSFMESMLPKISEARKYLDERHLKKIWLQVDGGISLDTISKAFLAGADTFVAGSAVFRDEDPGSMVDKLRAKISG
jgi:ribulose-phosphate 3-epimerase